MYPVWKHGIRTKITLFCLLSLSSESMGTAFAAASNPQAFSDVPASYWASSYVSNLTIQGIVNGDQGLFHPDASITRAEFAKLLVLAQKLPLTSPSQPTFQDVKQSDWYYSYIETAAAAHLVNGEENGKFAPNDLITREDMAKMIIAALPIPLSQVHPLISGRMNFSDQGQVDSYAFPYVSVASYLSLLNGEHDNLFVPHDNATRAEAAALIYRFLNLTNDKLQSLKTAPPLPPSKLVFDQSSFGTYTAGNLEYISAKVVDELGRIKTDDTGRGVHLTVNMPNGKSYPVDSTVQNGSANFNLTTNDAGHYTISITADSLDNSNVPSASFDVAPGSAAGLQLQVTPSPFVLPGESVTVSAEAVDAYHNPTSVSSPLQVSLNVPVPSSVANQVYSKLQTNLTLQPAQNGVSSVNFGTIKSGLAYNQGNSVQIPLTVSATSGNFTSDSIPLNLLTRKSDLVAGKGIWFMWRDWHGSSDATLLKRLADSGVSHLYLEVATSADGFYGQDSLEDFVSAAHHQGIAVIGWTYDALANPTQDAARDLQVAVYQTHTGDRVDALAPDIEETGNTTTASVDSYSQTLRQSLVQQLGSTVGGNYPLIAVTYPPQSRPSFPWPSFGKWFDVICPMDYWHIYWRSYSTSDAQSYVSDSIKQIRTLTGRSDMPITVAGQSFNLFDQDPGSTQFPTQTEVQGALQGALSGGAVGFSLYRYGTMPQSHWDAFSQFRFKTN